MYGQCGSLALVRMFRSADPNYDNNLPPKVGIQGDDELFTGATYHS